MTIILWLWLLGVVLAVGTLVLVTALQRFVRTGAEVAGGLLLASLPFIFVTPFSLPLIIVAACIHIWLLVLPARLVIGRLEQPFLMRSTATSALVGVAGLVLVALIYVYGTAWVAQLALVLWPLACLCVAVFCFGQLLWNLRHYKFRLTDGHPPMREVPTVSVCIPARNEDHALADCLQTVLASDYAKLEVIVLDDCSQDTTSLVIRSFAHDGVRFVQGDQPAEGWLGRNQALQTLAEQASGEYLLFMDVDTHIGPQTISQVMQYVRSARLEMVSVLPQNRIGVALSTIFGTLEYFWRTALPITKRRMPVSSKFWLVQASTLRHLGGFASVSRKIVPEESFAHRLASRQAYRFLVSNPALAVSTAKRWTSQAETSVRLLYPQLHRQPYLVLGAVTALLGLFAAPIVLAIILAVLGKFDAAFWLSTCAAVLILADYSLVLARTQPRSWLVGLWLWPLVVAQECVLVITSMLQYEFGEVNWKGRNVCYPVLVPQLRQVRQAVGPRQEPLASGKLR